MFRRHAEHEDESTPRPRGRSWSSRLAFATLFAGAVLLIARVSVATVVQIHGDGMAPSLADGDYVVLLRGGTDLERGDVVVYDPALADGPGSMPWTRVPEADDPRANGEGGRERPDARRAPEHDLRNTAVVDREELERNWEKVQRRSQGIATRERVPMRLGRILARPGDVVTFHVEGASLGLAVDHEPLSSKPAGTRPPPEDATPSSTADARHGVAYESTAERRYPVLVGTDAALDRWPGLVLPAPEGGPVELEAQGYLIVADNRDEGACCDSRALGFIPPAAVRGKVLFRLSQGRAEAVR